MTLTGNGKLSKKRTSSLLIFYYLKSKVFFFSVPTFDLQLPQQDYYDCPIVVEPEPVVKEFKEKTIESLDTSIKEESSFKKRKIPSVSKRNMRQRLDDD